jgi:hypothetical protein
MRAQHTFAGDWFVDNEKSIISKSLIIRGLSPSSAQCRL